MGLIRRHWALAALLCYGALAVILLFAPISPEDVVRAVVWLLHDVLGISFIRTGHVDAVLNVALFVPLGFLTTLVLRPRWVGMLVAVALSVSAELVQTLLPARTASLRDVITNAIGAAIGCAIAAIYLRRQRRRGDDRARPTGRPGEKKDPRS